MMSEAEKSDYVQSVEAAQELEKAHSPADQAAAMFGVYLPRFFMLIDGLSNNALRRVIKAIVERPLNEKPYVHPTDREKEAVILGEQLLESKFIMVQTIITERLEKEMREKSESAPASSEPTETQSEGK